MGGALYCASFGGAISKISTMLLHCHGSVAAFQTRGGGGAHAALSSCPGANVLGCSGNDPLKSLDFSLSLHRIVLTRHLLLTEAAVVDTVRVVEEETRFLVLAADTPNMSAEQYIGLQHGKQRKGRSHLHHRVPAALAQARCTVTHDGRDKGEEEAAELGLVRSRSRSS